MADRAPFPDIEAALRDLFVDLVAGCDNIGRQTPANLQAAMPYVRVQRIGGEDDGFTDSPLVAVDTFAADRSTSWALAEAIRQRLLTSGPKVVAGGSIDKGVTATGPNEIPWSDDQTVRRFTASYRVTVRR